MSPTRMARVGVPVNLARRPTDAVLIAAHRQAVALDAPGAAEEVLRLTAGDPAALSAEDWARLRLLAVKLAGIAAGGHP